MTSTEIFLDGDGAAVCFDGQKHDNGPPPTFLDRGTLRRSMAKARTQTRDGKTMNLGRLKFSSCAFPQGRFSRTEGTATAQASPPVGMDSRMSLSVQVGEPKNSALGAARSPRPQPSTFP